MRDYKDYYNGEFSNYDGANVDDFIEENEIATIDDNNVSEDTTYSSSKIEGLVSGGTSGSYIDDDQTSTGTTYSSSKIETLISGVTGTTYTAGDGIDITNNVISLISEINDLEVSSASTYSSSKIISILTGIGFSVVVVDELPGTGDTKTIYLVKYSGGWFRQDYYEEYIFILDDEPGHWELIGTTKIDLSEYYKKTDVDGLLDTKSNTGHAHEINEVDELQTVLDSKSNTGHTHDQYSLTSHTHTASEVGALPDTTVIPSKTSDLTNDSGFITGYTAGDNIQISGDTISATDTTYEASDFDIKDLSDSTNLKTKWNNKQNTLSAGDGIQISANTISVINDFLPIGSITMWATATPPTGWLICNGQSITASTYSALSEVLNADVVPDLTGRFPLGAGNSGEYGSTGHTIGETGGEEKHYLSLDEMPSHNHELKYLYHELGSIAGNNYRTFNLNSMRDVPTTIEQLNPANTTENSGRDLDHNNMPPYFTLNFIIKYK